MKKQFITEAARMQKLAGILTESQLNETQSFEDFSDVILDTAIENNIITQEEANDELAIFILQAIWDDEFEEYEETGQGISTSDYNKALDMFRVNLQYFKDNPREYQIIKNL